MIVLFRTRRVASEIRKPNSADSASEKSGSTRAISRKNTADSAVTGQRIAQAIPAAAVMMILIKLFITHSMNSRASRISRGRMGMDSSRSLSLASYSCVLAVNTVPTNMTAKSRMAYMAK